MKRCNRRELQLHPRPASARSAGVNTEVSRHLASFSSPPTPLPPPPPLPPTHNHVSETLERVRRTRATFQNTQGNSQLQCSQQSGSAHYAPPIAVTEQAAPRKPRPAVNIDYLTCFSRHKLGQWEGPKGRQKIYDIV